MANTGENFRTDIDESRDYFKGILNAFVREMPEKLRFLALASRHGDFAEVGFIAHHIAARCEVIAANEISATARQLEVEANSHSSNVSHSVRSLVNDMQKFMQQMGYDMADQSHS
jgi:HPt (histidine-containing phosphotransfer) domain-containing protein